MDRIKVALDYSEQYLEVNRPQPLTDRYIESLCLDVLNGKLDKDITDQCYIDFKNKMHQYLKETKLNTLNGLDNFNRVDIINGCTQFIDNLYMSGPIQVLNDDYRYHNRLNLAYFKDVGSLIPDIPLIIAMPFPRVGKPHDNMQEILDECKSKNIRVHIDAAWITSCRDITFDFNHDNIDSVGISLSKGLGLGWNRIGLRYTRHFKQDSVTIMNDFRMNNRALSMIGLYFLNHIKPDYLWETYGSTYYQICKDFNLTPTNSIHIAMRNNSPVGLSPLIRYVTEQ